MNVARTRQNKKEGATDVDWRQRIADGRVIAANKTIWAYVGRSFSVLDEDAEDLVFGKE